MTGDPKYKPEELRTAVLDYRLDHGLTLKALAAEIGGITSATLCNFENGRNRPSRVNARRIERFLHKHGIAIGGNHGGNEEAVPSQH